MNTYKCIKQNRIKNVDSVIKFYKFNFSVDTINLKSVLML